MAAGTIEKKRAAAGTHQCVLRSLDAAEMYVRLKRLKRENGSPPDFCHFYKAKMLSGLFPSYSDYY